MRTMGLELAQNTLHDVLHSQHATYWGYLVSIGRIFDAGALTCILRETGRWTFAWSME